MATAKQSTAKKPVTAKKTTAKASVAKKAPAKKSAVRKAPAKKASTSRAAKASSMRSFRVAKDVPAFTTFRITRQTVYWVILVAFIIFVQLWILNLQIQVTTLLDAQQSQLENGN